MFNRETILLLLRNTYICLTLWDMFNFSLNQKTDQL